VRPQKCLYVPDLAPRLTPVMALRADCLSDQIGPQQPISGAVAGNQPAMPSQALDLGPSQDSSAASVASDSSDSTANSSQGSTVPATSNTGGLEWLVYNPPTTPGGSLLAALRVCLMNRH